MVTTPSDFSYVISLLFTVTLGGRNYSHPILQMNKLNLGGVKTFAEGC